MTDTLGAILLAGGRATRMGGTDKVRLELAGRSLLARAIAAAESTGANPITVAGSPADDDASTHPPSVSWVREDPAFGGPAAAIVTALHTWNAAPQWTLVLACDLPGVRAAVTRLRAALPLLPSDSDGVCLGDESHRPQWLTAVYRTAALRERADSMPKSGQDASVRDLIDDLALTVIAAPADETDDIDTWEDLDRARARLRGKEEQ